MKWSNVVYYLQAIFVGAMMAICDIDIFNWRFFVMLIGVNVLTHFYGSLLVWESEKENK